MLGTKRLNAHQTRRTRGWETFIKWEGGLWECRQVLWLVCNSAVTIPEFSKISWTEGKFSAFWCIPLSPLPLPDESQWPCLTNVMMVSSYIPTMWASICSTTIDKLTMSWNTTCIGIGITYCINLISGWVFTASLPMEVECLHGCRSIPSYSWLCSIGTHAVSSKPHTKPRWKL